ncbi:MAG: PDZ domain-containing protein [Phycisphaerales bacterium]
MVDLYLYIRTDLASRPEKLKFTNADTGPGSDRGYAAVRLGVTPSMSGEDATGVVVEAVAEGTAAAEAGIIPGDILVAWNGEEMPGPAALMENLRKHKPGDQVQVVLMRKGEKQVVTVTLKAGNARRGAGGPGGGGEGGGAGGAGGGGAGGAGSATNSSAGPATGPATGSATGPATGPAAGPANAPGTSGGAAAGPGGGAPTGK